MELLLLGSTPSPPVFQPVIGRTHGPEGATLVHRQSTHIQRNQHFERVADVYCDRGILTVSTFRLATR